MSDSSEQLRSPSIPTYVELASATGFGPEPPSGAELYGGVHPCSTNLDIFQVSKTALNSLSKQHTTAALGDAVTFCASNIATHAVSTLRGVTLITSRSEVDPNLPATGVEATLSKPTIKIYRSLPFDRFKLTLDRPNATGHFATPSSSIHIPTLPSAEVPPLDGVPVTVGQKIDTASLSHLLDVVAPVATVKGPSGVVVEGGKVIAYSPVEIFQIDYREEPALTLRLNTAQAGPLSSSLRAIGGRVDVMATDKFYMMGARHGLVHCSRSQSKGDHFHGPLQVPARFTATVSRLGLLRILGPIAVAAGSSDVAQISMALKPDPHLSIYHYHRTDRARDIVATGQLDGISVLASDPVIPFANAHVHLRLAIKALESTQQDSITIEVVGTGPTFVRLIFEVDGRPAIVALAASDPGAAQGISKARRR